MSENGKQRRIDRRGPLKVALYSHDAMGVGHVRRNLLIGQTLARSLDATALMLCGVHEATGFCNGHGVDCLALPSFRKHGSDDYRPRDLRMNGDSVTRLRKNILMAALTSFEPDLVIVDKVPMGIQGELIDVLPELRRQGTKLVFGMREILDDEQSVQREWLKKGYEAFIRDTYDAVWVYGCKKTFDPIQTYDFDSLQSMTRFTGYLNQRSRLQFTKPLTNTEHERLGDLNRTILCMLGGGEDGFALASAFAKAILPAERSGLLVSGPLMSETNFQTLQQLVANRTDMRLVRKLDDADVVVPHVSQVICMGGYNSMLSVASFEKTALIVPRVRPRREQFERAELFAKLGVVDTLHPDVLTPAALSSWMASAGEPRVKAETIMDLNGLERICELVQEVCVPRVVTAHQQITQSHSKV